MRRRTFLASTAAALAAPAIARGEASQVLKFVPQADLAVLDPVWTTTYQTRDHGLLVFDTLFGLDSRFKAQPQMAEGAVSEDDGKTWRIVLRPDLLFHDDTRVLARDCVASIRRWGARDGFGQALARGVRRDQRARRQDDPVPPEVSLPVAARRAGQDPAQHLPDHAGASRRHRPLQAGHRDGRQRPVSLQGRRTRRRLAHRLSTQHQVRAATERHARCDRRPEGRALRPHRVADHSRRRHGRGGDAERRDRLVADAERRSAAAAEEAGAPEGRDGQSHRHDRHAAVQPPQPAVRQSGVAPRDAGCGRAGGLHDRRRRHRRKPVARRGRHLLSRYAAGEPTPAWRC